MEDSPARILLITDERRLRFIAEAGRVLASSLDFETTLSSVARLAVPTLADCCLIDLFDENGVVRRVAVAHANPAKAELALEARRYPPDLAELSNPIVNVLRSGVTSVVTIENEVYRELACTAQHEGIWRRLAPRALLIVPLILRARTFGAMTFLLAESARTYGADDVATAEELADRAALSVDNARLYRQAQLAVRGRDEVLAVVSHDLRNPLSRIYLASDQLLGTAPESLLRHIEIIRRSAQHMNRLIQDLLEVTRIDAGQLRLERQPHALQGLLRDAVEMISPAAQQRCIQIVDEVPSDVPAVVVDRVRMVQALSNLLDNAVKHTPDGGQVLLRAEQRTAETWVSVRDRGCGISPEHIARVFDRFWQAQHGGRDGVGLGLAIAKGIVEAHGGRIWVDSGPQVGTTFVIAIPS